MQRRSSRVAISASRSQLVWLWLRTQISALLLNHEKHDTRDSETTGPANGAKARL